MSEIKDSLESELSSLFCEVKEKQEVARRKARFAVSMPIVLALGLFFYIAHAAAQYQQKAQALERQLNNVRQESRQGKTASNADNPVAPSGAPLDQYYRELTQNSENLERTSQQAADLQTRLNQSIQSLAPQLKSLEMSHVGFSHAYIEESLSPEDVKAIDDFYEFVVKRKTNPPAALSKRAMEELALNIDGDRQGVLDKAHELQRNQKSVSEVNDQLKLALQQGRQYQGDLITISRKLIEICKR